MRSRGEKEEVEDGDGVEEEEGEQRRA